ncbi:hypothetical protein [Pseudomonas sp. UBA6323]|uniref:hypothetical protein n=1 Tax=Pseudomonas sp. UBA6323 TaxID=1947329 RepID=UPI0025F4F0D8|nr:hypothetical protein [Pseudomonas sp. UBA6323]
MTIKSTWFRCLLVLLALAALFLVYRQGVGGALFYDDYGNLEGLAGISDWSSVKSFIFNGISGPLGRPIALASFVPQAQGWPSNSAEILLVNIFIHLVNAVLIGALGYLCVRALSATTTCHKAFRIAFLSAFLWACLPLLASTTLIAIQRMTGLAAMFSLIGLVGYTWSYRLYVRTPICAFFVQMTILGLGTLLAMFTKENGLLTPLYALVIELSLRGRGGQATPHWLDKVRLSILVMALIIVLVYLSPVFHDYFVISEVRGYSVWERLQVQVVILWEYMRAFVAPLPSLFGPFHDDYAHTLSGFSSSVAALAWLAVLGVAVWLFLAGRTKWVFFAVLWFAFGHLLESTSIMLELYFEHRNYLPVYGFCLALAVGVQNVPDRYRGAAILVFAAFCCLQLLVLWSVVSVWGEPRKAAELWASERPASSRAVTHAVLLELSSTSEQAAELNVRFISRQRYEHVLSLLDRTIKSCSGCVSARLQSVSYACKLQKYDEAEARLQEARHFALTAKEPRAVVDGLFNIRELIQQGECGSLSNEDLLDLVEALSGSRLFQIDHISTRLYFLMGAIAEDKGDNKVRDEYLAKAEDASPVALPVLEYQVYAALASGQHQRALDAIDRRYAAIKSDGGIMTRQILDAMREDVMSKVQQVQIGVEKERLE